MFHMKKIAFIGLGVMGNAMAQNLMKAGYSLKVYTRTKEKAAQTLEKGALWCDTVAECVKDAEAVITIVGYPKDVESVYFGETGILENAPKGCYLIDMTTTEPGLSARIYAAAKERGMFALDAPVSGGDTGARNATLAIMVGGDEAAFEACKEILAAMGSKLTYTGGAGCGQHTKMANQIAIAGAIAGVSEALSYARATGLDPQVMLEAIASGAAGSWQLSNQTPKMMVGDYAPGFFIKHFIKDMRIADEAAREAGAELGVLELVLAMYKKLEAAGDGELGTQALIRYYEK